MCLWSNQFTNLVWFWMKPFGDIVSTSAEFQGADARVVRRFCNDSWGESRQPVAWKPAHFQGPSSQTRARKHWAHWPNGAKSSSVGLVLEGVYSLQPSAQLRTELIKSATQIYKKYNKMSKPWNCLQAAPTWNSSTTLTQTRYVQGPQHVQGAGEWFALVDSLTLLFLVFLCINTNQVPNPKHSGHLIWTKELGNNASWTKAHLINQEDITGPTLPWG